MAFDEPLAARIRKALGKRKGLTEKRMFGGIGFLIHGNMCCGAHGTSMIVRVDPDEYERTLAEAHARPFDLTGRPMKGWIMVGAAGVADDKSVAYWVEVALEFVSKLPPK